MLLPLLASPSRSLFSLPPPHLLPSLRSTTANAPATNRLLSPPSSPCSLFRSSDQLRLLQLRRFSPCRADLSHDAPYAAAIGACILSSFAFPIPKDSGVGEGEKLTDSRFGVMGIVSIIPYFNWLCWVFAWMDSEEWRYLVYSAAYLAPYFRTNLSLSPEESWLPITSILLCIIHVQLETSIRNGDIEGFSFSLFFKDVFKEGQRQVKRSHKKVKKDGPNVLPSANDAAREKLKNWEIPREPSDKQEQINDDGENADEGRWNR